LPTTVPLSAPTPQHLTSTPLPARRSFRGGVRADHLHPGPGGQRRPRRGALGRHAAPRPFRSIHDPRIDATSGTSSRVYVNVNRDSFVLASPAANRRPPRVRRRLASLRERTEITTTEMPRPIPHRPALLERGAHRPPVWVWSSAPGGQKLVVDPHIIARPTGTSVCRCRRTRRCTRRTPAAQASRGCPRPRDPARRRRAS
jgi:hypothetical protein